MNLEKNIYNNKAMVSLEYRRETVFKVILPFLLKYENDYIEKNLKFILLYLPRQFMKIMHT